MKLARKCSRGGAACTGVCAAEMVVATMQVRRWDDLPKNAKDYIARIQELIGVKIEWIGVGPGRDAIVIQP